MDSYRVEVSESAEKVLLRLPSKIADRIYKAAYKLAANPFPAGTKKLIGSKLDYRIRVGDYRVIYQVRRAILRITVVRVGHRKDIYD